MTDDLLAWLTTHEGPWAYVVLGLACLVRLFAWQRTRPTPPPVEYEDEFD